MTCSHSETRDLRGVYPREYLEKLFKVLLTALEVLVLTVTEKVRESSDKAPTPPKTLGS